MASRMHLLASVGLLVLTVVGRPSLAGPLYQPDMTPIPVGPALQQIFDQLGEPIDAIQDAQVFPQAFLPQELPAFTLHARSGPYRSALGWYNDLGSEPALYELHAIFNGSDDAGTVMVLDFWSDPDYLGADIGFVEGVGWNADIEDPSTLFDVGSEKLLIYTQPDYTPGGEDPGRFIHVIVYASVLDLTRYYFAFEDTLLGDNDFDDLVVSASNLAASGGDVGPEALVPRLCLVVEPSLVCAGGGAVDVMLGLPSAGAMVLDVLDAAGRRVRTLRSARFCDAGFENRSWDGRDDGGRPVDAGLYFLRLQSGRQSAVRRIVRF